MKNLYYFSKEKLQYIEIKKIKQKLFILFLFVLGFLNIVLFEASNFLKDNYRSENEALKEKVDEILALYKNLNTELDSLNSNNNSLRLAANLEPISNEELLFGVGGGSFDNSIDFLSPSSLKLEEALSYVDKVTNKILFEKNQYLELTKELKKNKELSRSLPAIKPCSGELTSHGFGMRMHPILHIIRMHEGIDIVTNSGTEVHSAAKGIVEFNGFNGGFGLTVVINHGFGYRTIYAHLSKIKVKKGDKINRGDIIALSGNTGLSTGPHLHYEVEHNNQKLDPEHFFFYSYNYFN